MLQPLVSLFGVYNFKIRTFGAITSVTYRPMFGIWGSVSQFSPELDRVYEKSVDEFRCEIKRYQIDDATVTKRRFSRPDRNVRHFGRCQSQNLRMTWKIPRRGRSSTFGFSVFTKTRSYLRGIRRRILALT